MGKRDGTQPIWAQTGSFSGAIRLADKIKGKLRPMSSKQKASYSEHSDRKGAMGIRKKSKKLSGSLNTMKERSFGDKKEI